MYHNLSPTSKTVKHTNNVIHIFDIFIWFNKHHNYDIFLSLSFLTFNVV